MKFVIFLFLIVIFTGCDNGKYDFLGNKIKKHSYKEYFYKNGKIKSSIEKTDNKTIYKDYYRKVGTVYLLKEEETIKTKNKTYYKNTKKNFYKNGKIAYSKVTIFNKKRRKSKKYEKYLRNRKTIKNTYYYLMILKNFFIKDIEYVERIEINKYSYDGDLIYSKKVNEFGDIEITKFFKDEYLKGIFMYDKDKNISVNKIFYKSSNLKSIIYYKYYNKIIKQITYYDLDDQTIKYVNKFKNGLLYSTSYYDKKHNLLTYNKYQ